MRPNIKDITGNRFHFLVALSYAGSKHGCAHWNCICDCGNETVVSGTKLRKGHTKSCGCLPFCGKATHGYSRRSGSHPLYRVWEGMKARCYNPNFKHFVNYGGRGIEITEEWKHSPDVFIKWAKKNGYKKGLEIDRIENDGNYEPENCRFVTHRENNLNKRLLSCRNKSGYVGVFWGNQVNKWISKVSVSGKQVHIGFFIDKIKAAKARDKYITDNNLGYPLNFSEVL
jgi:hypothetical protein